MKQQDGEFWEDTPQVDFPSDTKFFKVLFGALAVAFTAIILVVCLASCRSFKTVADKHPIEAAKYCAGKFPPKTKFVPGKTIYKPGKHDTVLQEGKTIIVDCPPGTKPAIKLVKCPPTQIINVHDTLYHVDTVFQVNTAAIDSANRSTNIMRDERDKALKSASKRGNFALWGFGLFAGLLLLLIGIIIYANRMKVH